MENPFPPRCAGRFSPIRLLASGAYGSVWLARQDALRRQVVVKLLHPELVVHPTEVRRFLGEARLTGSLSHPNIVIVIDHDVEDGQPWIAFEYLPGLSLRAVVNAGPASCKDALTAGAQVARALQEAHSRGVIHRDIKPENILVVEPGRYKVADFGISKWAEMQTALTASGLFVGTPSYAAPEQILGAPATPQTDIFALGMVLHEMVTGRKPFPTSGLMQIVEHRINGEVPRPSELNPAVPSCVDDLIMRALARQPRDRYPSALAFEQAIVEGLERLEEPEGVRPSGPPSSVAVPEAATVALPRVASGKWRPDRSRVRGLRVSACAAAAIILLLVGRNWLGSPGAPRDDLRSRTPAPASVGPSSDRFAAAQEGIDGAVRRLLDLAASPASGASQRARGVRFELQTALDAYQRVPGELRGPLWTGRGGRHGLAAVVDEAMGLAGGDPKGPDPVLGPFFVSQASFAWQEPLFWASYGRWMAVQRRTGPGSDPSTTGRFLIALGLCLAMNRPGPDGARAIVEIAGMEASSPVGPDATSDDARAAVLHRLLHLHAAQERIQHPGAAPVPPELMSRLEKRLGEGHHELARRRATRGGDRATRAGSPVISWSAAVEGALPSLPADALAAVRSVERMSASADRRFGTGRSPEGPLLGVHSLVPVLRRAAVEPSVAVAIMVDVKRWLDTNEESCASLSVYWLERSSVLNFLQDRRGTYLCNLEGVEAALHEVEASRGAAPARERRRAIGNVEMACFLSQDTAAAVIRSEWILFPWLTQSTPEAARLLCLDAATVHPTPADPPEPRGPIARAWLLSQAHRFTNRDTDSYRRVLGRDAHDHVTRVLQTLAAAAVARARAAVDSFARRGRPVEAEYLKYLEEASRP